VHPSQPALIVAGAPGHFFSDLHDTCRVWVTAAWSLEVQRALNLAKLLDLLKRKAGFAPAAFVPAYKDDNVFVCGQTDLAPRTGGQRLMHFGPSALAPRGTLRGLSHGPPMLREDNTVGAVGATTDLFVVMPTHPNAQSQSQKPIRAANSSATVRKRIASAGRLQGIIPRPPATRK
jgi:hypothetical protein